LGAPFSLTRAVRIHEKKQKPHALLRKAWGTRPLKSVNDGEPKHPHHNSQLTYGSGMIRRCSGVKKKQRPGHPPNPALMEDFQDFGFAR
jgi:hypothetical protein